jgi:hypothetical protein
LYEDKKSRTREPPGKMFTKSKNQS